MDFSIGQVVYSKAGRDKKRPFIVLGIEGEFLFLSDGGYRPVHKPKKKKKMHVQPTKTINENIAEFVKMGVLPKNSDVRKAVESFLLIN